MVVKRFLLPDLDAGNYQALRLELHYLVKGPDIKKTKMLILLYQNHHDHVTTFGPLGILTQFKCFVGKYFKGSYSSAWRRKTLFLNRRLGEITWLSLWESLNVNQTRESGTYIPVGPWLNMALGWRKFKFNQMLKGTCHLNLSGYNLK